MAVVLPTYGTGVSTYDAQCVPDSTDEYALGSNAQGNGVVSGVAVTPGSLMVPNVAAGTVAVAGALYAYAGGTVTVGAASAGDRRDTIVARLSAGSISIVCIPGTPASLTTGNWTKAIGDLGNLPPVKASVVQATDVVLAEVYVCGSGGTATTTVALGNIIDKRNMLSANPLNVAPAGLLLAPGQNGWDAAYKAAIANQGAALAGMAFIGDSITAGQMSPSSSTADVLSLGWVGVFKATLLARLGNSLGAEYFPISVYSPNAAHAPGSGTFTTSPWSNISGAASTYSTHLGMAAFCAASQAFPTGNATFSPPLGTTEVDIHYVDYSSGTWQYSVDGGAAVTITTTGPGTQVGAIGKVVKITGLSAGTTHTVAIGNSSGSNVLNIQGCSAVYTAAAGIGIGRLSIPEMKAVDWTCTAGVATGPYNSVSMPTDRIACLSGQSPQGNGGTLAGGFGFPTAPAAAVVGYGINDSSYGSAILPYGRALGRIIQSLRRGYANCSILLLALNNPDAYSDNSSASPNGRTANYYAYKEAMKNVALAYNCNFLDVDAIWGQSPVGQGYEAAGNLHPTTAGHAAIASYVARAFT